MTENQKMYVKLFKLYFGQANDNAQSLQETVNPTESDKNTGWY